MNADQQAGPGTFTSEGSRLLAGFAGLRVGLTGATGAIGSALAARLLALGAPVRALARDSDRARRLAAHGVEVRHADLSDPQTLRGAFDGCAVVYHLAAKIAGLNRPEFEAVNVGGAAAALAEARRAGAGRFIHVSSIAVYGYPDEREVREDHPLLPSTRAYVATKQAAEAHAREAMAGLAVSIARAGDVYGPGQETWTTGPFAEFRRGLPHARTGDGLMNPVYIDNLVDALLLLGTHPAAAGDTFNIVDGTPVLMSDYFRFLARAAGRRDATVPRTIAWVGLWAMEIAAGARGQEPRTTRDSLYFISQRTTFSNARIRERLGWSPAVGWEAGLRRTADWLRQYV